MNSPIIQLLVLAGIAVFLILRLRGVLGTREGFEKPTVVQDAPSRKIDRNKLEVIEGGVDRDILDHVAEGSAPAQALMEMKKVDPEFNVTQFLQGARAAYEMILMAFERGDLASIRPFISEEIYEAFSEVIAERSAKGQTIEANFLGVRELTLKDAVYDATSREADMVVRFTAELTYLVRDNAGDIIDGSATEIKRQKDVWTFSRVMGSSDPNWRLVATDQ